MKTTPSKPLFQQIILPQRLWKHLGAIAAVLLLSIVASGCEDTTNPGGGPRRPPVKRPATCPNCDLTTHDCIDNVCTPKTPSVPCNNACDPTTQKCVKNKCVSLNSPEACDPKCALDEACESGRCVKYIGKPCNPPCEDGETCMSQKCYNIGGGKCGNDQILQNDGCFTPATCAPTDECMTKPEDWVCLLSACYMRCKPSCQSYEICDGTTGKCSLQSPPLCVGVSCGSGKICQSTCTSSSCPDDSGTCVDNPGDTCPALNSSIELVKLNDTQPNTLAGDFNTNATDGSFAKCNGYTGTGSIHHTVKFVVEDGHYTKLKLTNTTGNYYYTLYKGCPTTTTKEEVCGQPISNTSNTIHLTPGTYFIVLQTTRGQLSYKGSTQWGLTLESQPFTPGCENFDQYTCSGNTLTKCETNPEFENYAKPVSAQCPSLSTCVDNLSGVRAAECTGMSCDNPIVIDVTNQAVGTKTYTISGQPGLFIPSPNFEDESCETYTLRGIFLSTKLTGLKKDDVIKFVYDPNISKYLKPNVYIQETCGPTHTCLVEQSERTDKESLDYTVKDGQNTLYVNMIRALFKDTPDLNIQIQVVRQ